MSSIESYISEIALESNKNPTPLTDLVYRGGSMRKTAHPSANILERDKAFACWVHVEKAKRRDPRLK
jgi:hypothetical protein